jgi:hypothetical protein
MDANGLTNREWTRIWVVGAFGYDRERFFIRVYSRPFAVSQSIRVHSRLVGGLLRPLAVSFPLLAAMPASGSPVQKIFFVSCCK